jgi:hypothetical protein
MVIVADADFVGSAWLVAVTCTVAVEGRSAGAVYTPFAVIVPLAALPPATPFTFHVTAVSVALVTVAVKVCVLPSRTELLEGVTETLTERGGGGGGGGGATGPAPPPPQPSMHDPVARRARNGRMLPFARAGAAALSKPFEPRCGRGRMAPAKSRRRASEERWPEVCYVFRRTERPGVCKA